MCGIIKSLHLTSEKQLTVIDGQQNYVLNALDNTILRPVDALGNIIEGKLSASLRGRLIYVLIHSIKHPNDTKSPDLSLYVDTFEKIVIDSSEGPELLLPYIKVPLITALRLRLVSIFESFSNKVFPNINWLEISELSVIHKQYHTHKAIFNLVSSEDPNSVTFKISVFNIQSTCNEVNAIADLTLVITKKSDKITINISGSDKYHILEESPILRHIRNSLSKKLAEKGHIEAYRKYKQEVSEANGNINITWIFSIKQF